MATITDVSRHAGVSRSTVSRVIADNGYVSEAKRRAIEQAIAELGYRPNTLAQALRSNRSNVVGGVVVDIGSPFYAEMVAGIQAACRAAGKSLMVSSGFADRDEEARAIMELIDRSCDGLVVYLENDLREDVAEMIRRARVPVVTIGGDECPPARARVKIDNFGGAFAATTHLLDMGHRAIVHLSGQVTHRDTRERLRGIGAALDARGLGPETVHVVNGSYREAFGHEAMAALLASGRAFTAVFAGDDDIAAGALMALREAGRSVPEDVSLIGFNDNSHCRHLNPVLTTVRQPVNAIGRRAAELLLRLLGDPDAGHVEERIDTPLIIRESVKAIPPSITRKELA